MYSVIFTYGKDIEIPASVITSSTDTTLSQYYLSSEPGYSAYNELGLSVGDDVYIDKPSGASSVYISTISAIAAGTLTISSNPGTYPLGICQRNGFIVPYVKKEKTLTSYPLYNYCGMYVVSFGNFYTTYPANEPYESSATTTSTNSVLAICFKKGEVIEEIRITVLRGRELEAIQKTNAAFRAESDLNFDSFLSKQTNPIVSVDTIVSNNISSGY